MPKDNIQQRLADVLLQRNHTVLLGGTEYEVAPPTIGTLVAVSGLISEMPDAPLLNEGREWRDVLLSAKDYGNLSKIIAWLVLGYKEAEKEVFVRDGKNWSLKRGKRVKRKRGDILADRIMMEASPGEIKDAIVPLLSGLELTDFFAATTFLQGANITKPTKVETGATASGRQ